MTAVQLAFQYNCRRLALHRLGDVRVHLLMLTPTALPRIHLAPPPLTPMHNAALFEHARAG
jgi:hypothetical protein